MQAIVLTSTADVSAMISTLRTNHIPMLKVVSGWGAPWNDRTIAQVAALPELLVRTVSGDGCRPPANGQTMIFLEPEAVLQELTPWLNARPTCYCELGNEPNGYDPSDDAAWNFRYWFMETVGEIREVWPAARIVAPGLVDKRQAEWWAICADAFNTADAVAFHAYAWHTFSSSDTGQLQRALSQLGQYFPNKTWLLTEAGINDGATSANTKATRYGELHKKLPSQIAAACWYHYCDDPTDVDMANYRLPASALPYLHAGGAV